MFANHVSLIESSFRSVKHSTDIVDHRRQALHLVCKRHPFTAKIAVLEQGSLYQIHSRLQNCSNRRQGTDTLLKSLHTSESGEQVCSRQGKWGPPSQGIMAGALTICTWAPGIQKGTGCSLPSAEAEHSLWQGTVAVLMLH